MFDIGATELLLIAVVAILVIGPKDMPLALRTAGRWIGKLRRVSAQFRSGIDSMVREAELEDMEKKWKAQNEKIMREHPEGTPAEMEPTGAYPPKPAPTPAQRAEDLKQIAAKQKAAADEAEQAARHAEAEARLAESEQSAADNAEPADTTDKAKDV